MWLIDVWVFVAGEWAIADNYGISWLNNAIASAREFGVWALVGWTETASETNVPTLLANSAYAPTGELMAMLRGERQEAA